MQYLKRFYLSNSCMTYPPKEIYKTILYLACKTEATHMPLSEYARRISTDPEQILAPEYKVMQALRFTLDVKQPFRGLKGVLMELLNLAEGLVGPVDGMDETDGDRLKDVMLELPSPQQGNQSQWKHSSDVRDNAMLKERIQAAYSAARGLLDAPALLTDAYFLYAPSQILLAAMHVADTPLTTFYLSTKLPTALPARPKILATIHSCAEMLQNFSPDQVLSKDDRTALEAKLELCRDPGTRDLVKAFQESRLEGDDDEKANRKKMKREQSRREGDALFGPSLMKPNGKGG